MRDVIFGNLRRQKWYRRKVGAMGWSIDYGWWCGKWEISIFVILEGEMVDKMGLLAIRGTISGLGGWRGWNRSVYGWLWDLEFDGEFWVRERLEERAEMIGGWIFKLVCGITSLVENEKVALYC